METLSRRRFVKGALGAAAVGKMASRRSARAVVRGEPEVERMETSLYDLEADPYELEDIASRESAVFASLVDRELKPWLEKTADPWLRHLRKLAA